VDVLDNILNGNSQIVGGQYERTIDKNNRFVIPSELRDEMPVNTVIRIMKCPDEASGKCLYVYSEEDWAYLCQSVKSKLTNDEKGRRIARKFATSFVPGKVDVSGRFTLDKELKEFAGITDKLMIVSSFNHKEIWSVDAWVKENGVMDDVDLSDLGIAF